MNARKEVMASLIEEAKAVRDAGGDAWAHLKQKYPGMPTDVIAEAWGEAEDSATEAWWKQIEKTIDGEIIKNAIEGAEP